MRPVATFVDFLCTHYWKPSARPRPPHCRRRVPCHGSHSLYPPHALQVDNQGDKWGECIPGLDFLIVDAARQVIHKAPRLLAQGGGHRRERQGRQLACAEGAGRAAYSQGGARRRGQSIILNTEYPQRRQDRVAITRHHPVQYQLHVCSHAHVHVLYSPEAAVPIGKAASQGDTHGP